MRIKEYKIFFIAIKLILIDLHHFADLIKKRANETQF